MRLWTVVLLLVGVISPAVLTIRLVDNGIADPTIIHTAPNVQFEPVCKLVGARLDIMFVLDASGSLKGEFGTEVNVVRKILDTVAVGSDATRVALITFSGQPYTGFHFNTYTDKNDVMKALDRLRPVNGVTRTGRAFQMAYSDYLLEAQGLRGSEVPKIVFLLSDGRSHDFPNDTDTAQKIREKFPGLEFWAYGTGDYPAFPSLLEIVDGKSENIVTKRDVQRLPTMFEAFKAVEVCTERPVCVVGSDKPIDLLFVLDASESIGEVHRFKDQLNFIQRVLNNVNVHPRAVKVGLIHYSGTAHVDFNFNRFQDKSDLREHINTITATLSSTRTDKALQLAFETLQNESSGIREGVPKVVIVLTDGHSQLPPAAIARRLNRLLPNITVFAIALSPMFKVSVDELRQITDGKEDNVFTRDNLEEFETRFMGHIGFGCLEICAEGQDCKGSTYIEQPIEQQCSATGLYYKVRTKKPFNGWLFVKGRFNDPKCKVRAENTMETSITIQLGSCGLQRKPFKNEDQEGYKFTANLTLQFHEEFVTGLDKTVTAECVYETTIDDNILGQSTIKSLLDVKCQYTLRRYYKNGCTSLDARVGDVLYHNWQCDNPPNYGIFVHDCYAISDEHSLQVVNEDGCEMDPYLLETPKYDTKNRNLAYGDWAVYKYPKSSSLQFKCKVSFCDMEAASPCKYMVPTSTKSPPHCPGRIRDVDKKIYPAPGFALTLDLETRRLNVLENENTKPTKKIAYCSN